MKERSNVLTVEQLLSRRLHKKQKATVHVLFRRNVKQNAEIKPVRATGGSMPSRSGTGKQDLKCLIGFKHSIVVMNSPVGPSITMTHAMQAHDDAAVYEQVNLSR